MTSILLSGKVWNGQLNQLNAGLEVHGSLLTSKEEMNPKLAKRLSGIKDSRSTQGIVSRGANIYKGASMSAHKGGGSQFGRPKREAVLRRLRMRRNT